MVKNSNLEEAKQSAINQSRNCEDSDMSKGLWDGLDRKMDILLTNKFNLGILPGCPGFI